MSISIVIPAHNEANVIDRLLGALTDGARDGEIDVIVVCNGCTDDTARRARVYGPIVRVIETPVASKSHALNLGDRAARGFPRFYIDADVVVSLESVRGVAAVLDAGAALAAAPRAEFDLSGCASGVRAFYRVWQALPYLRQGMVGSGAYALGREGRARFDQFPAITADDAFVRLQFRSDERQTVPTCSFTVTPPRTLGMLIRIKTRGHFGNFELKHRHPHLFANEDVQHGAALRRLAIRRPAMLPDIAIYAFVRLVSRLLSYRRYYLGNHRFWERDNSSRMGAAAAAPSQST